MVSRQPKSNRFWLYLSGQHSCLTLTIWQNSNPTVYNIPPMPKTALLLVILPLLLPMKVDATSSNVRVNTSSDNSNIRVNVDSNVNSSSTSEISTSSSTNVHINQSGEGTSTVKINGKEYKLEGPGEINASNGSTQQTSSPGSSITHSHIPTPQVLSGQDIQQAIEEKIEQKIETNKGLLNNFLISLFSRLSVIFRNLSF